MCDQQITCLFNKIGRIARQPTYALEKQTQSRIWAKTSAEYVSMCFCFLIMEYCSFGKIVYELMGFMRDILFFCQFVYGSIGIVDGICIF